MKLICKSMERFTFSFALSILFLSSFTHSLNSLTMHLFPSKTPSLPTLTLSLTPIGRKHHQSVIGLVCRAASNTVVSLLSISLATALLELSLHISETLRFSDIWTSVSTFSRGSYPLSSLNCIVWRWWIWEWIHSLEKYQHGWAVYLN